MRILILISVALSAQIANSQEPLKIRFEEMKSFDPLSFKAKSNIGIPLSFNLVKQKFEDPLNRIEASVLNVVSNNGFSGVAYEFLELQKKVYSKATWEWKVDRFPRNSDEPFLNNRDQPIQIIFVTNSNNSNFYAGLSYVWTVNKQGHEETYQGGIRSLRKKISVMVKQARYGKQNDWLAESVDLTADFKKFLKLDSPKIIGVIIYADTNHTQSSSKAAIKNIVLK